MNDTTTTAPTETTKALITAEQIEKDCPAHVQNLGKQIAAHYEKLVKCEERAEQHKTTIGQLLMKAKETCDKGGFAAFRERYCPNLGKSRVYELLAIGSGKKSIEQSRADNAERNRRHRVRNKAAEHVRHVTEADINLVAEVRAPQPVVKEPEPESAEASAEVRKAAYAAADTNDGPPAKDMVGDPAKEPVASYDLSRLREAMAEVEVQAVAGNKPRLKEALHWLQREVGAAFEADSIIATPMVLQ